VACERCGKASWNYCGECCLPCLPPGVRAPAVRLPLRVEVLRGKEETAAKSTASMLAASSPDVRIWLLPAFPPIADARRVLLLYPSPSSVPVTEVDAAAFDALLVIDTTWQRAGGVLQLPQLAAPFVHVHLRGEFPGGGPHTVFWRHQPLGPACLSTAEAIYYALRGLEVARARSGGGGGAGAGAALSALYDGRYDDLLAFFLAQYRKVQAAYASGGAKEGQAYTRKMRAGYIREGGGGGGGEEAEAEAEAPSARSNESRRKRLKLKGGWCVGKEFLDAQAAQLMEAAQARFVANNVEGAAGGGGGGGGGGGSGSALFEKCASLKHEYAATGRLLSKEEVVAVLNASGSGAAAAAAAAPPKEGQ
jgi:hypothetical protein